METAGKVNKEPHFTLCISLLSRPDCEWRDKLWQQPDNGQRSKRDLSTDAWGKGALHFNSNISRASTSTDFMIQRGGVASEQDYLVIHSANTQGAGIKFGSSGDITGRSLTVTLGTLGFTRLCLQLT